MKKTLLSTVVVAILLCNVGCMHERCSVFGTVGGPLQKVHTKNRYALVGVKHEGGAASSDLAQENLQKSKMLSAALKQYQPDVFSDDGIGFMLRTTPLPQKESYDWTVITWVCSLCTLPLCFSTESGEHFKVDVLDNPDASETFDVYTRTDFAFSQFSPTPCFAYLGDAAPLGGGDMPFSASRHSFTFMVGHDESHSMTVRDESKAYLVAVALKKMEDAGLINGRRSTKPNGDTVRSTDIDKKFELVNLRRDDNCAYRYSFALKCRNGIRISLADSRELKRALRHTIREDYCASFPDVDASSLIVEYSEFSIRDGEISGKSVVLSLSVEALQYDSDTRKGTIRVRMAENQFADARLYARKNVESLVREKNIALAAHEIPSAATFYLLNERVEGDVLEITFKTE